MKTLFSEQTEDGVATERWVQGTALFQSWAAMKREILLHKWYESERAGSDIGWDRALVDWMVRYGCHRRDQAMR